MHLSKRIAAAFAALLLASATPITAQEPSPPAVPSRTTPVGLPQDAGPHDESAIEWWYFNAFLTGAKGKRYAVVGSFFRTGIGARKGHYLIYSLADLDTNKKTAYSTLDRANLALLRAYLPLAALRRPDDPRPMQLLALLQKGKLPPPHRTLPRTAVVLPKPFRIIFGKNSLVQASPDARTWRATLAGDDWTLKITLAQPDRPPMLVGGAGKTGLDRPDDMYYLSLTRMRAEGTLTRKGRTETVAGEGWLDRQWGTSWVVRDNGWDWFGLQLSDGSDLIAYRVRDNATGKILRAEATLLDRDGRQTVDTAPTFTATGARWTDPQTKIAYPQAWTIVLPQLGRRLTVTPAFPSQTIPVLGIGDAIWEGVVTASGTTNAGASLAGHGYMELVGYRSAPGKKN